MPVSGTHELVMNRVVCLCVCVRVVSTGIGVGGHGRCRADVLHHHIDGSD